MDREVKIKWNKITINDQIIFNKYVETKDYDNEYFTTNFISEYQWSNFHQSEYAIIENSFVIKTINKNNIIQFLPPITKFKNIFKVINILKKEYGKFYFTFVEEEFKIYLENKFNDPLIEKRDLFNYIYDIKKFKSFKGKKLSHFRNNINKIEQNFLYDIMPYRDSMKMQVLKFMNEIWKINNSNLNTKFNKEIDNYIDYDKTLIDSFNDLKNFYGMIIKINNKIEGFIFWSISGNKTAIIHIKKTNLKYSGLSSILLRDVANSVDNNIKFLSLEEDYGNIGLRENKLRHYPEILKKRYESKI